jgi:mono/diheme cytochrome c family protein
MNIVDNQLVQPKISTQKIIMGGMAIALVFSMLFTAIYVTQMSDPYLRAVFSIQGDLNKGERIFAINCAGCHGIEAYGNVGPSLKHISQRKSKIKIIEQVTAGKSPPMPKFQPNTEEMADLLAFLEKL